MDFLINALTTTLLFLYQFVGHNTILTIVVVTLLIRLAIFPLTQQQIKASKAMQQLQPRLNKLQQTYRNDRDKLAAELIKLYRHHNTNLVTSALPLLLQAPILYVLYVVFSRWLAADPLQLLELYHHILVPGPILSHLLPIHNQFLWLNLALPDPLFILPVLVVATTHLQLKLMPPLLTGNYPNFPSVGMSPIITLVMPLMIGILSLQFASGLSIYWIVSNIVAALHYDILGKTTVFP